MCDGGADRADNGANQQRQVWYGRQHKSAAAAPRLPDIVPEIDEPSDNEQHTERRCDRGVGVASEDRDGWHEDDELLERVHLHSEVALEDLISGGARSRPLVSPA